MLFQTFTLLATVPDHLYVTAVCWAVFFLFTNVLQAFFILYLSGR